MKISKISRLALFALTVSLSVSIVVNATDCYKTWYRSTSCSSCDDSTYNSDQRDSCSGKHKRQNGIKLCSTHISSISSKATYYKRGFSDYNCLAYALGKNSVQSWTWPSSWGSTGPTLATFKTWISNKGYSYTTNSSKATGTNIIYVYGITSNGKTYVQHFSRKYTLDGKTVNGAATISKWGACSLYTTSTKDPYKSTSGYGNLVLTCYK